MYATEFQASELRALIGFLKEEASRFNMNFWAIHVTPEGMEHIRLLPENVMTNAEKALQKQKPPCGTVMCLAGGYCIMRNLKTPTAGQWGNTLFVTALGFDTLTFVQVQLGLSIQDAKKLFMPERSYGYGWPKDLWDELEDCEPGTPEYVAIGERRVELWIETGQ